MTDKSTQGTMSSDDAASLTIITSSANTDTSHSQNTDLRYSKSPSANTSFKCLGKDIHTPMILTEPSTAPADHTPRSSFKCLGEETHTPMVLTEPRTASTAPTTSPGNTSAVAPASPNNASSATTSTSHSALFGLTGQSSPTKFAGSGPGSGVVGTMGVKGQHNSVFSSDAGGLTGGKTAAEAERGS